MHRKQSEEMFVQMAAPYGVKTHKWRDAMYCPRCGNLIYKMDKALDYTVYVPGGRFFVVECKQVSDSRWAYEELRENQRQMCEEWIAFGVECYIFLAMKAKNRRLKSFLIPYLELVNRERISDRKSLSLEKDAEFLASFDAELVLEKVLGSAKNETQGGVPSALGYHGGEKCDVN